MIPRTHIDVFDSPVRGVLSAASNDGWVISGLCQVVLDVNKVHLKELDDEYFKTLEEGAKVSVLVVDPLNVDRWLCIQGTTILDLEKSSWYLDILKIIAFPK